MSCKDCPDTPVGEKIIIVYTGGPPSAPFAMVRLAINNEVVYRYSPTVHPDGSIEYDEVPKALEGYELQDKTLKPIWASCVHRMLKVFQGDTGQLAITATCIANRGKALALDTCVGCSVRLPI